MTPCTRSHCPSSKHSCQRYSCTIELRNRVERRRSERDHLKQTLEAETNIAMKSLRKLREYCSKFDRDHLQQAKQKYEDQASKTVRRPECYCVECAVEYKDREIASLRKTYRALQAVQQAVVDGRKSRPTGMSSPARDVGAGDFEKHARHAAFQPNGVDVRGNGNHGVFAREGSLG